MINQEQYRKAILSELGITQWRLSAANLLDKSHPESHPDTQEPNISQIDTSVQLKQTSDVALNETQLSPTSIDESQPSGIKPVEPEFTKPTREAIDVSGKLVIEADLKPCYPEWFWQDLTLALNSPLDEVIWLTELQEPKGDALCLIRVQSEDNSHLSGQHVPDIQLQLSADLSVISHLNAGSKKTLWDKLQAVLKSSE